MNCPLEVGVVDVGVDTVDVTTCLFARINWRPPIETIDEGVAVTGEDTEVNRVGSTTGLAGWEAL